MFDVAAMISSAPVERHSKICQPTQETSRYDLLASEVPLSFVFHFSLPTFPSDLRQINMKICTVACQHFVFFIFDLVDKSGKKGKEEELQELWKGDQRFCMFNVDLKTRVSNQHPI